MSAVSPKRKSLYLKLSKAEIAQVQSSLDILEEKKNPYVLPLLRSLIKPLIKAALLYFGAKTEYRISDKLSNAIADHISDKIFRRTGTPTKGAIGGGTGLNKG